MELTGIHHLTAISAAIKENHRFYTQTLGMRLVKRSVNQDDVSAYHLFYADAKGSPGTDLTFFDWPVPRERRGTRSIVRTCLRVSGEAALAPIAQNEPWLGSALRVIAGLAEECAQQGVPAERLVVMASRASITSRRSAPTATQRGLHARAPTVVVTRRGGSE